MKTKGVRMEDKRCQDDFLDIISGFGMIAVWDDRTV